jgi:mRNA (guanine-N7-)-methyltransferase
MSSDGKFGNEHFECRVSDASKRFSSLTKDNPFGHRYVFRLIDAVEDCEEFLVPFDALQRLAMDYDLELIESLNFHQMFYRFSDSLVYPQFTELLHKMRVFDSDGNFPPKQWEIACRHSQACTLNHLTCRQQMFTWHSPSASGLLRVPSRLEHYHRDHSDGF